MVDFRPGALACALVLAASPLHASPPPVTMSDVIHYQAPVVRNFSFDGSSVLGDFSVQGQPSRVVRWTGGGREALAQGTVASASPDGHWLIYLAGGDWVLRDRRSGAERRFTPAGTATAYFGVPVWSKDSRFVAAHYDLRRDAPPPPAPVVEDGVRFVERDSDHPVHAGVLTLHRTVQFLVWPVSETQPIVTTVPETSSYAGAWTVRNGEPTYYYGVGEHALAGPVPFTAIRAFEPNTRKAQELVRFPGYSQGEHPKLSPDGTALALAIDIDTPVFGVASSVVVVDLNSGRWKRLSTHRAVSAVQWASDGWIYFTARHGGLKQLGRIDGSGQEEALSDDALDRENLVLDDAGATLAYTTTDGYGRTDIRRLALSSRRETVVETLTAPSAQFTLGTFKPVHWPSADGLSLQGFLIFPPNFDTARRYPVLIDVHGSGPGASLSLYSLFGWTGQTPLEWHAWAALGYVVFVPDYRSSGEYGAAVNKARVAASDGDVDGIAKDAGDIEAGTRWLLSQPFVDSKRIAIFGHSAGGGRVNYLLTRSSLFAAGIVHEPVNSGPDAQDLEWAQLGLPATWTRASAAPSEQRSLGASFLFDGWRSTTPTLIMVGNPDKGGVDPLSAEMLYSMLLAVHVPTKFVHYLDDGHVPNSPESAEHRYAQMKAWLDTYLAAPSNGVPKAAAMPSQ